MRNIVLLLLLGLFVSSCWANNEICRPEGSDVSESMPFTWCRAGDIGRVPMPLGLKLPSWTNEAVCDESECKSIRQVELFSPPEKMTFAAVSFASNESVIVITPVSLPESYNYSEILFPAKVDSFSLVTGLDQELQGLVARMEDGSWYYSKIGHDNEISGSYFTLSLHAISSPLYRENTVQFISHAFVYTTQRSKELMGVMLVQESESHEAFLIFSSFQESQPFAVITSLINITHINSPGGVIQKLDFFLQRDWNHANLNRTLFVLSDEYRVHIVQRPLLGQSPSESLVWNNDTATSLFYISPQPQLTIFQANFFSESSVRTNLEVPYVWMSLAMYRNGSLPIYILNVTLFPEFGSSWENDPSIGPLTPVGSLGAGSTCGGPSFFLLDGLTCMQRITHLVDDSTRNFAVFADVTVRQVRSTQWISQFPGFSPGSWSNTATENVTAIFLGERFFVHVYGVIPIIDTPFGITIESMNMFIMLGNVENIEVSENGVHVAGVVSKAKWELDSINRFDELCTLATNTSNLSSIEQDVLEQWKLPCASPHRRAISSDFVQYVGMCPVGSFCYSVRDNVLGQIEEGSYAPFPLQTQSCPLGSFCFMGQIRACPPGFICPRLKTVLPTVCHIEQIAVGKTCSEEGLSEPIEAPLGMIPRYPQAPPFPAPPGHFAHHTYFGYVQGKPCLKGDYCALGRDESQDLRCPAGTYCASSSFMFPLQCSYNATDNYSSYCPPGSAEDLPCPAGNYCQGPTNIEACLPRYYCPSGTMRPNLCPAGFYCPTPSEKIVCPKNHYCELGTATPTPCAVLSLCPPGTKNNSANFLLTVLFSVIAVVLIVVWRVAEWWVARTRAETSRKMQEAEKKLQQRKLAKMRGLVVDNASDEADKNMEDSSVQSSEPFGLSVAYDNPTPIFDLEEGLSSNNRPSLSNPSISTSSRDCVPSNGVLAQSASTLEKDDLVALIDYDLNTKMSEVPFKVDITFKELGLKLKGTDKTVLDGVTGTIKHGRLTAVMGPSGAGKTTFMSTLANKAHYGDRIGTILLNGQAGDLSLLPNLVGYVPQEDIMLRELSVIELLSFNANMRLPASMSAEEKANVVRRTIRLLGLFDIRHELIGDESKRGISGGQRKRVNIGMELVSHPTVLFLDEPTSGLDATSSLEVCSILRRVAEEAGMTVISVIHQPRYDIFTMFHDVLLLGKGGRTVYLGPTKGAVEYFSNLGFDIPPQSNPADFLIDVVSGAIPRNGYPEYVKEDLFQLWIEHSSSLKSSGIVSQSEAYNDPDTLEPSFIPSSVPEDYATALKMAPAPPRALRKTNQRSSSSSIRSSRDTEMTALEETEKEEPIPIDLEASCIGSTFTLPRSARRKPAGFFNQLWWFFARSVIQQKRNWLGLLTDFTLVVVSATTFGIVFLDRRYIGPPPQRACDLLTDPLLIERCALPVDDPIPQIALMTCIGLALPAAMAALRIFGPEKVVFWRESSVGAKTIAYYLGKELAFLPLALFLPTTYTSVFYQLTVPRISYGHLYVVYLGAWWCATGLSVLISVLLPVHMATIASVVVVFGMSMFSGVRPTLAELQRLSPPFNVLSFVSFFRWLTEAYYLCEIFGWKDLYSIDSGLDILEYKISDFKIAMGAVFGLGLACRVVAFLCLELMHRSKRK